MEIVAVLHDVRSVHNTASIFRTADAAGVKKIFLCGITPTPIDRFKKVRADFAKVSLGAERSVAWEHCEKTADAIAAVRDDGYTVVAVEQSKNSVPYFTMNGESKKKIALVFGNEVEGLASSILKMADVTLEIPMGGRKESLNVSVAFGIVVFRLRYPYAGPFRI